MKKTALLILLFIIILSGCGKSDKITLYLGKGYEYEKGAFGGMEGDRFVIYLNDDGTYTYTEGMLSSHASNPELCSWEREGDIITLTEDTIYSEPMVNRFRVEGDSLAFIEEGSTNFIYVKVADGEKFNLIQTEKEN